MKSLYLNFHGIRVRIESRDELGVLDELLGDFRSFQTEDLASGQSVLIELRAAAPLDVSRQFFFRNDSCSVYGWNGSRVCDYGAGSWVRAELDAKSRRFEIYTDSARDAHELAYLALLSSVGECLDLKGLHRVHALGIEMKGQAGLVILPSGGGKSAIATLLLRKDGVQIYSDETPLIEGRNILPFPMRMALKAEVLKGLDLKISGRLFKRRRYPEKILFEVPDRRIASAAKVSFLWVGIAGSAAMPSIQKCSRSAALWALLQSMVIGIGVAQISEYMIRAGGLVSLLKIALSRLRGAVTLAVTCENYAFHFSADARKNADLIFEFLEAQRACHEKVSHPKMD